MVFSIVATLSFVTERIPLLFSLLTVDMTFGSVTAEATSTARLIVTFPQGYLNIGIFHFRTSAYLTSPRCTTLS
jgi:hypothetical protein